MSVSMNHHESISVGARRMMLQPQRSAVVLLAVGLLVVCGCEDHRVSLTSPPAAPTTGASQSPSTAINRTYSAGGTSEAPGVSVLVSADRSEITTADRLRLTLSLTTRDGTAVDWLPPKDRLGDFQIAESSQQKGVPVKGLTTTVYAFLLEPFLDGTKAIPSLKFSYREGAAATRQILTTEPIAIEVRSMLATETEPTELAPIKPPLHLPSPSSAGRWVVTGMAGLLAIGYPLAFVMARRASRRHTQSLDPVDVVKHRLADLRSRIDLQGPDDGQMSKSIAGELAASLREYLSALVHEDVRGLLTHELADRVRKRTAASSSTEEALQVLGALDQQRFSSSPLSPQSLIYNVEAMERFVATTSAHFSKEVAT